MRTRLTELFHEILREVDTNEPFRLRLESALGTPSLASTGDRSSSGGSRKRRQPALIDPYQDFSKGEEHLRKRLGALSVEQLKDVVSEYALDASRLALKWKSPVRLIELIVANVRNRMQKGDGFRA